MKKVLLSLAVLACGTAMAQNVKSKSMRFDAKKASVQLVQTRTAEKTGKLKAEFSKVTTPVTKFNVAKGPALAGSDLKALYDVPTGAFCEGVEPGAGWYSVPYIYTPGLVDQTWWNYTSSTSEDAITYTWTDKGDYVTYDVTEEGHGVASMFGMVYTPTLTAKQGRLSSSTYQLGQSNSQKTGLWGGGTDAWTNLGNAIFGNGGGPYGGFEDLELKTNTPGETEGEPYFDGNIIGFAQIFDAPNDLYTAKSAIITLAVDDNSNPAPLGGKELKCTVRAINEDGSLGDVIATAVATDENMTPTGDWLYSFEFVFTEIDPLFGETEAPIVINGTPVLVTFEGFENVNTQFEAPFCSAGGFIGNGYYMLDNGQLSSVFYRGSNYPQLNLLASLTAYIPVAKPTEDMPSLLNIPAEGGYAVTQVDGADEYNDFDIYTLTPLDEWEVVDMPEWLIIDTEEEYEDAAKGVVLLFFGAEASDEPQAGNVVLECYGKQLAITVVQGNVDQATVAALVAEAEAINANGAPVTSIKHATTAKKQFNNKVYNVLGQQVAKNTKGLVIKNGQKFLNK